MSFEFLDQQMAVHRNKLRTNVNVRASTVERLASTMAEELYGLTDTNRRKIRDRISGVVPISFADRMAEIHAFQMFMDNTRQSGLDEFPEITRAKVTVQNYMCFVYMREPCITPLKKMLPQEFQTRKCAEYLTAQRQSTLLL